MRDENIPALAELLRESLANGRQPLLTITSNSMAPLLRKGDQIILAGTHHTQLKPGDIITIENAQSLLTHRYWHHQKQHLITRGDRPLHFDPPIPIENLIGHVITRKRDQKALNLDVGLGKWLNKHLIWLAKLENKLTVQAKPESIPATPQWWQMLLHKLFHGWGQLLTWLVEHSSP